MKENGVDDELVDEKTSVLESDGGEPKTLAATGDAAGVPVAVAVGFSFVAAAIAAAAFAARRFG